jgi:hypothetical protein
MKYLKQWLIFENMGYENLEISRDDYYDLITGGDHQIGKRVIFQPNQISEINKFLSKWNITLKKTTSEKQGIYHVDINYNGGEDYQLDITIIPIEDEWFLLNVREYKSFLAVCAQGLLPRGWDLSGRDIPFYKCDQMGGLLQFLETKMKDLKPKRKKKDKYGK